MSERMRNAYRQRLLQEQDQREINEQYRRTLSLSEQQQLEQRQRVLEEEIRQRTIASQQRLDRWEENLDEERYLRAIEGLRRRRTRPHFYTQSENR